MPIPTAAEMVALYIQAEQSVLKGKSVRMGDRMLGKEDLGEIRAGRKEWEAKDARIAGRGGNFKAADFRVCE